MSCKIHGRTCSGDHASDVPPSRDGISLQSRSHTLTRATLAEGADGLQFVLDFAAIRVGIILTRGMSPYEVHHRLEAMQRLIEREFGIENDTTLDESKSHTRYGAQKG